VQDPTPVVADHEEAVQNAKGQCRHREEVHRCDRLAMVLEPTNRLLVDPLSTFAQQADNIDMARWIFIAALGATLMATPGWAQRGGHGGMSMGGSRGGHSGGGGYTAHGGGAYRGGGGYA
jgi:uncharacterized membrane protein YgcG